MVHFGLHGCTSRDLQAPSERDVQLGCCDCSRLRMSQLSYIWLKVGLDHRQLASIVARRCAGVARARVGSAGGFGRWLFCGVLEASGSSDCRAFLLSAELAALATPPCREVCGTFQVSSCDHDP